MKYLIDYPTDIMGIRKGRGQRMKLRVYSVDGGDYETVSEISQRVHRSEKAVRASINAGRPVDVSSVALRVVGGPKDGEWMTATDIAACFDVSVSWVIKHKRDNHWVDYVEPDRVIQKAVREAPKKKIRGKDWLQREWDRSFSKPAAAFARLPRFT